MTANKERVRRQVVLSAIPVPRVHWRSRLELPAKTRSQQSHSSCWQLGRTPAALVKIPASGTLGPRPSGKEVGHCMGPFTFGTGTYSHGRRGHSCLRSASEVDACCPLQPSVFRTATSPPVPSQIILANWTGLMMMTMMMMMIISRFLDFDPDPTVRRVDCPKGQKPGIIIFMICSCTSSNGQHYV